MLPRAADDVESSDRSLTTGKLSHSSQHDNCATTSSSTKTVRDTHNPDSPDMLAVSKPSEPLRLPSFAELDQRINSLESERKMHSFDADRRDSRDSNFRAHPSPLVAHSRSYPRGADYGSYERRESSESAYSDHTLKYPRDALERPDVTSHPSQQHRVGSEGSSLGGYTRATGLAASWLPGRAHESRSFATQASSSNRGEYRGRNVNSKGSSESLTRAHSTRQLRHMPTSPNYARRGHHHQHLCAHHQHQSHRYCHRLTATQQTCLQDQGESHQSVDLTTAAIDITLFPHARYRCRQS